MKMAIDVIVGHPARQYSHQVVYALQQKGMLKKYFVEIWYKPEAFPYNFIRFLPSGIKKKLVDELEKRYFSPLNSSLISEKNIVSEFISRLIKFFSHANYINYIYKNNWKFDKIISREINNLDFDIFIGYETSSLNTFKTCKDKGKIAILDCGSAHYTYQDKIFKTLGLDLFNKNDNLRKFVSLRKDEEIVLADYILTPSEFAKNTYIEAGVNGDKLIKIPFGFDKSVFSRKRNYRKSGKFKVLFVGTLALNKGVQYLLKAFRDLKLNEANLCLIGGVGNARDVLAKYSGLFNYIPYLHHRDLTIQYQEADIFVLPSMFEGFAQVVIEAMACGTPVIITPNTGSNDAVRDGVDGFIVPIMNIECLKEKIEFLYEDRNRVEMMGRSASEYVQRFTWQAYGENLSRNLIEIWNNSHAGALG